MGQLEEINTLRVACKVLSGFAKNLYLHFFNELATEKSISLNSMVALFKKIGLAIAFSPRSEALLSEAIRLKKIWKSQLVLIHVGETFPESIASLNQLLITFGLSPDEVTIRWVQGEPAAQVLAVCREEKVDLIIAGALKKENILKYYLGTIARKILRKANCSVLLLLNPSTEHSQFKNIVVNAEDSAYVEQALLVGCELAKMENSNWLHIVREIKLFSLTMSAAEQCSEDEYTRLRNDLVSTEIDNVQNMLNQIPHEGLKVNIKILSGKSGYELAQFTTRKHADLLVIGAPPRKFSFFDRVFPHDQEYIFADLPCNLLFVHPRKEAGHA